ncbi:MAG: protein kinase [Planctomycetota bacterium]|nr:protein kinase [Planctomycetota bacterium]
MKDLPEDLPTSEADLLDQLAAQLAAQLADGSSIDWDGYRARGVSERQIRAFRTLAMLRTAPPDDEEDGDGRDPAIPHGYEVLEVAGRGGYARVLKARDETLGRIVALKILDPVLGATDADRERFLREARTMAQTEHPNVLRIFGLHTAPARTGPPHISLALEWIDGEDFGRIIERRGPLHPIEAVRVGIDVCEALQALHDRGVVHRDVKPQNIMRRRGGTTILLDFGIARRISDEEVVLGSTAGTPAFEAPEVLGGGQPTPASDLFSVGVLLYWLMTGLLPVPGASAQEQRDATKAGRFVPLWQCRTDVPKSVSDVVSTAMSLLPGERPASAKALADALRRVLLPADQRDPAPSARARRFGSWATPVAALAAAAGVLIGFELGATLSPADADQPDLAADGHRWIEYPSNQAKPRDVVPAEIAPGAFEFRVPYEAPAASGDQRVLRCPEDFPTIQEAIDASQPFDRILIGAGTWNEALSISKHPVELCSQDGPRVTRLDATGLDRAAVSTADLEKAYSLNSDWRERPFVVRGLSITGGTGTKSSDDNNGADRYGGGLHLTAIPAVVEHCVVYGNGLDQPTTFGGGIVASGTAKIRDCVVLGNAAWACGGGIFSLGEDAEVLVERCTVFGNSGRDLFGIQGGLAASHGGTILVKECIVWGNAGEQVGTFGPYEKGAVRAVNNCIISDRDSSIPRFVDFRSGDLRLVPGFAGVDADGRATHGALQSR